VLPASASHNPYSASGSGSGKPIKNRARGLIKKRDPAQLFGYAAGIVPGLLASAVVSGGATTITLPDHTGITFGNLTQLNASDLFAA
jgi:hypothetical protein